MKKLLLCVCVYAFLTSFLSAGGKVETRTVENPESWEESFDLTEKKQGKYNVLVTAEDSAGLRLGKLKFIHHNISKAAACCFFYFSLKNMQEFSSGERIFLISLRLRANERR